MKTMCPPSYYHNGFVATHALRHMMCDCAQVYHTWIPTENRTSCVQVHELP